MIINVGLISSDTKYASNVCQFMYNICSKSKNMDCHILNFDLIQTSIINHTLKKDIIRTLGKNILTKHNTIDMITFALFLKEQTIEAMQLKLKFEEAIDNYINSKINYVENVGFPSFIVFNYNELLQTEYGPMCDSIINIIDESSMVPILTIPQVNIVTNNADTLLDIFNKTKTAVDQVISNACTKSKMRVTV